MKLSYEKMWNDLKGQIELWRSQIETEGKKQNWSDDELKGHDRAWRYVLTLMEDQESQ